MDLLDKIMAYESGDLTGRETLQMFADLIKGGTVWTLQGHYGRTAQRLLDTQVIDGEGNILDDSMFTD